MRIVSKGMCVLSAAIWLALACPAAQTQAAAADSAVQTPAAIATTSSAQPDAQPPATRPAKVWTNDDLSDLHSGAATSPALANRKKTTAKPAPAASTAKSAAPYRDQIDRLQAQLLPIDSQVADLQSALSGQPSNAPRKYIGVRPGDWQSELDQLQKKRADIETQIQAVRDRARHNGVPANALP